MFRVKKWAQKAHARPERRRAARQKEVGNQSQFPVDRPQNPAIEIEGNGNQIEAGTQPPIEDWAPSEGVIQGDTEWMNWIETEAQNGPTAGNRLSGGPVETGDSERPRESEVSSNAKPERQQEVQMLAARPVQSGATPGARMIPCSPREPTGNGKLATPGAEGR
jgi:hypothetical protein